MFDVADFLDLGRAGEGEAHEPVPDAVIQSLALELTERTFAAQRSDPDGRLMATRDFPGYLTTQVDGWTVFVPWSVAKAFPGDTLLATLLGVGAEVAVGPAELICVSGSSTTLGRDIAVGDLDYCQYVDLAPASVVEAAEAFTAPTSDRVLVSASYGREEPEVTGPWTTNWAGLAERMRQATSVAQAERFMVEFLTDCPRFGVMPVSNVVLSVDFGDRSIGPAAQSFVYQEAVAVRPLRGRRVPPWTLIDPSQLGRYIRFLRREVRKYAESNPIKAAKRATNLAAILGLEDFLNLGLAILSSADSAAFIRRKRRGDVHDRLAKCDEADSAALRARLADEASESGPMPDTESEAEIAGNGGAGAFSDARAFATVLLGYLNRIDGEGL